MRLLHNYSSGPQTKTTPAIHCSSSRHQWLCRYSSMTSPTALQPICLAPSDIMSPVRYPASSTCVTDASNLSATCATSTHPALVHRGGGGGGRAGGCAFWHVCIVLKLASKMARESAGRMPGKPELIKSKQVCISLMAGHWVATSGCEQCNLHLEHYVCGRASQQLGKQHVDVSCK